MKKNKLSILLCPLFIGGIASLASCGSKTQLDTPKNISYDFNTGKVAFDAVEGATTYTVGVSEIINDVTGKKLEDIKNSSKITVDGKETYVWATQIGSLTSLSDKDGDGKVEGKIVYRSFSSTASDAGQVIKCTAIPKGDFVLTVMADKTDSLAGSEYGIIKFSNKGALKDPTGFSATFTEDNKLSISEASNYYIDSLSTNGMPEKMEIIVKEDGNVLETISFDDFSYTNSVIGPAKSYNFTNSTVTTSKSVDKTKKITATVQAKGNGDSKTDSAVCDINIETTTPALEYATKYDCSGSGKAGDITVNVNVGVDSANKAIFGLEAKVGNVVIARESGTYTVDGEVTDIDGKKTFEEGKTLTFTTEKSDLATKVMDGKTLTVTKIETEGWGGKQTNWGLLGEGFAYNGSAFSFTGVASSGGGFGPGPF